MRRQAVSAAIIKVQDLRVGMFVHLDGGWLSHPFPRSSFKIASADQIAIIRSLGVNEVDWSPDRSDPPHAIAESAPAEALQPDVASQAVRPSAPPAKTAERQEPHHALSRQRTAQAQCERQFNEAAQTLRELNQLVTSHPETAREQCESLAHALTTEMLSEREVCLRVLNEGAGERSSVHAMNVTVIAMLLGKSLALSRQELLSLGIGAMLHDIGKIDLPNRVRFHDSAFSSADLQLYQEHVALGVAHAKRMGLAPAVVDIIAQHHEQADGKGFPAQLHAGCMSRLAHIVALSNRYDNLCNPALPARALTPHEAIASIFTLGRSAFDGPILDTFIRMMGIYPPGSAVQLTDDRYAIVVSANPSRPLKPKVLVHEPSVPVEDALLLNLERDDRLGIRRSLKTQQLPDAALEYLAPRQRMAYFFESTPAALVSPTQGQFR